MLGPSSRESVPLLEVLVEEHGLRFACEQYQDKNNIKGSLIVRE
jgi:hypothetical protein